MCMFYQKYCKCCKRYLAELLNTEPTICTNKKYYYNYNCKIHEIYISTDSTCLSCRESCDDVICEKELFPTCVIRFSISPLLVFVYDDDDI